MTTISANSTTGIYLTSPSYTNPVVINRGVTITNTANGVYGFTGAWTIANDGTIAAPLYSGVYLGAGGSVTNAASASISGYDGVNIAGGIGTVTNSGSIAGSPHSSIGVVLAAGGSVANQSGGTISGYTGVDLTSGGAVTNAASASITGVYAGIGISGGAGSVVNHGYIAGTGVGGIGIILGSGSTITNAAAASITGTVFGVDLFAGGTLTNAGTIVGNAGTAVVFGGTGSNLLVLDPGYELSGFAIGGTSAVNTLELASAASTGTLSGLGTEFVDFAQTTIDANASWVFNGANTIGTATTLTELSGATLTVSGTLENDGSIAIDPSTLIAGGLTGAGLVTIGAGSVLDVQGAVASGETIMFAGVGADLNLGTPGSVAATVTNFAQGETIDVAGISPASVSYSGGLLSFSGGSFALALANPGTVTAAPSLDGAAISVQVGTVSPVPPTISGTIPGQAITDQGTIAPFALVTIADSNVGQTETVTVTPSNPANGALSDPNAASDGSSISGGVYSVTGSAAAVTADLEGLVFTPTRFQVPPGQTVTTTFTIHDIDTADETVTNNTTSVIATAAAVPPPVVTAGASVSYTAGSTPVTLDPGLTVSDANGDTEPTMLTGATVSISAGLLAGDTLSATASEPDISVSYNSGTLTLTGTDTLLDYQTVLDSITYSSSVSDPTNGGADLSRTMSWVVKDGTVASNASTSSVSVSAGGSSNPSLNEPSVETVAPNSNTAISGSYGDSFAQGNSGDLYLGISDSTGTLTATDASGHAVTGSGTNNISLSTDYVDLNAILSSLHYTAGSNLGSDTINFDVWNQAGVESAATTDITIGQISGSLNEPSLETVAPNSNTAISGSYGDSFAQSNPGDLYLGISDRSGTLTAMDASGHAVTGSGTNNISLSTDYVDLNAILSSLHYTAGSDLGSDTINFDVWNQAGVEMAATTDITIGQVSGGAMTLADFAPAAATSGGSVPMAGSNANSGSVLLDDAPNQPIGMPVMQGSS